MFSVTPLYLSLVHPVRHVPAHNIPVHNIPDDNNPAYFYAWKPSMLFDFVRCTYILYIQYNIPASKYNSMLYSIVNVSCVTPLQIPAQIFERAVYLYPSFSSKESPGGIMLSF